MTNIWGVVAMRLMITMVFLMLAVSSSSLGQSPKQPEAWRIIGQVNGNRVEFKCLEGCYWNLNSVSCIDIAECRWTVDQSGLLAHAEPFDYELELERGRLEYKRRQEAKKD